MTEGDASQAVWEVVVKAYEGLHKDGNFGMTLVPLCYALTFGIYRLAVLWPLPTLGTPTWNWAYALKLLSTTVALAAQALDLGAAVAMMASMEGSQPFYVIAVPAVGCVSMAIALALLVRAHNLHKQHCHFLSAYWVVAAVFYLPLLLDVAHSLSQTRGLWSSVHAAAVLATYVGCAMAFLVNLVAEPPSAYKRLDQEQEESICPEGQAGFLSRITFHWMNQMVFHGWYAPITQDDLWSLNKDLRANEVATAFGREWEKELATGRHSLSRALARAFWGPYIEAGAFKIVQDVLAFTSPQLLRMLISFARSTTAPMWHGYVFALSLMVVAFLQTIMLHQYFHRCFQTGLRVRSALVTAVYQKSLVLSNSARKESTQGEITNLMSVDAQRLMDLTTYLHVLWSGPFQMAMALYFLYDCMGPSMFAGIGVMVVLLPLNSIVTHALSRVQNTFMTLKDNRMVVVGEALNGIRMIKMHAWEGSFMHRLMDARWKELKVLAYIQYTWAALGITWGTAPFLVSLAMFSTYVLTGHVLVAEKAFVALALFNLLQFPINMLPYLMVSLAESISSVKRITKLLTADEVDPHAKEHMTSEENGYAGEWGAVSIRNGTFKWDQSLPPALHGVDLNIAAHSLTAIVGRVGSGKSSLIAAILGNLVKVAGEVMVNGRLAYVAQEAWIQNATVRENILFGQAYNEHKYRRVLEACALVPDLAMFQGGDMTEIGEKGINLSGGQKQRVALARAVYQDCDIYVLDDPLSAVDAHVAQHIFNEVLGPRGLLCGRTRLLVTHRVDLLPRCDYIAVMKDGKISDQGRYNELVSSGGAFAAFLEEYVPEEEEREDLEMDSKPQKSLRAMSAKHDRAATVHTDDASTTETARLTEDETVETGGVSWQVLGYYLSNLGWGVVAALVVFCCIGQACQILTNVWLSVWASRSSSHTEEVQDAVWFYLGVYSALGVSYALASLVLNVTLTYGGLKASQLLHNSMLANIIRAPMSFFDTTPMGRIINRFSKDLYTIDQVIPECIQSWLSCLVPCLGSVVVISMSTPAFLFAAFPLMASYFMVQRFYVATSRQLKRLDSTSRSPIFSHFGETLSGIPTIRAFGQQKRFMGQNADKLDDNAVAYYASVSSNRWLAVRLEIMGNLLVFFAALFAALARGKIDPAFVGLSVSYALGITQQLNWMVRMTSELESNIVAVERVAEYTDVPQEAPDTIEGAAPPVGWPHKGEVEFSHYSLRYRPDQDLVLKDISIKINPMEKIGIVGRTGAGKSSLSLALFRMVEAATGHIVIDGLEIAQMGLRDLRSNLTIIPQDPLLFVGTVRSNLDPFNEYDDLAIWRVLQLCHLAEYVRQADQKLDTPVNEGGSNLSMGQRQLMCLGRALLRKSKILVLDEATAAVDLETDQLIQATIRTEFTDCTILVIAHRLNTIMDCDRVLVLGNGHVVEFDRPAALLATPHSQFYAMALQARLVPTPSHQRLLDLDVQDTVP